MSRGVARVGLIMASAGLVLACVTTTGPVPLTPRAPATPGAPLGTPGAPASVAPPLATATTASPGDQNLQPDPAADYSTGDTALLSGGEFVGDQAELTVEQAVLLGTASSAGHAQYAFLVVITGRDDTGFHFNLLDFTLIDDQDFQYSAYSDGGLEPRLEFGDLGPDQRVRGWMTFEVPTQTATVRLEYSPAMALEAATFGFLVP